MSVAYLLDFGDVFYLFDGPIVHKAFLVNVLGSVDHASIPMDMVGHSKIAIFFLAATAKIRAICFSIIF